MSNKRGKPKLSLVYYGNPILRKKAEPVEIVDQEIKAIVEEMDKIMEQFNGVGLAAPQVGLSLRIFILRGEVEGPEGKLIPGPLQVFINPKLFDPSETFIPFNEGCLSIPGVRADVIRPETIVVEATDLEGNRFKKAFEGLEARIIMHENDHINGVLFIDRLPKKERESLDQALRAIKKKFS